MSLRTIHLLFITLSTLLASGCATLLWFNNQELLPGQKVWAGSLAVLAVVLVLYGAFFLAKMQKLSDK